MKKIIITESQLKKIIKEQGFGDYPEGTTNDFQAPWNQDDAPESELTDIELVDDDYESTDDVYVILKNDRGGEAEIRFTELLNGAVLDGEQENYFVQSMKSFPRPNDFEAAVFEVAKRFVKNGDVDYMGEREYEAPNEDDYVDDFREEINEQVKRYQEINDYFNHINEGGQRGKWKEEWFEEDQIIALYNALYSIEDMGISKQEVANTIIGSSVSSLAHQTLNFKTLLGEPGGLSDYSKLQKDVFNEYGKTPKNELRNIVSKIISKNRENPNEFVRKFKAGAEIGDKRDQIKFERQRQLAKQGYNLDKLKLVGSKPKYDPTDDEVEDDVLQDGTTKAEVKDFLSGLINKVQNLKTGEGGEVDALIDDIKFISDYIDSELSDKQTVSEIYNKIKKTAKRIIK